MAKTQTQETGTDLIVFPEQSKLPALFVENGTDELTARIRQRVEEFKAVPRDMEIEADRKELWKFANDISSTRKKLEEAGKGLVAEAKEQIRIVDKERIRMAAAFDDMRDEVLKPRTEWQAREDARIKGHEDALAHMNQITGALAPGVPSTMLIEANEILKSKYESRNWENFQGVAQAAYEEISSRLNVAYGHAVAQEAKDKELDDLRAAQAAQMEKDKAETHRKEGEDKARKEAEREKAEALGAQIAAENNAKAADKRAADNAWLAMYSEAEGINNTLKAAAKAKQDEIDRHARIQQAKDEEDARRAADQEHRGKFNREALHDLMLTGLTEQAGIAVLKAIVAGKVSHIKIEY